MEIKYCCTYWGSENDAPKVFVEKVLSAGYQGIEIFLSSPNDSFAKGFIDELEKIRSSAQEFVFIPQQITATNNDSVDDYIIRLEKNIGELIALNPTFINSHTGKDHYTFDDNCKVIEAIQNISNKTGVRILHETHRGRFSFHASSLLPYLKLFPEMELVGDFSHFCAVSESMLEDQEGIIAQIIPHVSHIHARIGHDQGPQVNDPFAPEWQDHFRRFEKWWQSILNYQQREKKAIFTITPEFGPAPYMPSMPFTKEPLGNQWEINLKMMSHLKKNLQS